LNFSEVNSFMLEMRFTDCQLHFCDWKDMVLSDISFVNCHLQENTFERCDMRNCRMESCNMDRAQFTRNDLRTFDVSSNYNFSLDPELNKIKGMQLHERQLICLLFKYELDVIT
jgi:uncharacterized protein YjbI with pentapeptide repeats